MRSRSPAKATPSSARPGREVIVRQSLFRAVAQDLDEADGLLGGVPEHRHLAARVEALAVLAQMPSLVFGAAGLQRVPHFDLRATAFAIFRREEPVDRPSPHLRLGPAEQPMGALVPAGHPSREVGRDDRIVDHAVEDLPVAHLALADQPAGLCLLGRLDAGAEEAFHDAVLATDGRVGVGEVRLLRISVALHHEHDVVGMRRPAGVGVLHQRPEITRDLAPDLQEGPAERAGMVTLKHLSILVIVEEEPVRPQTMNIGWFAPSMTLTRVFSDTDQPAGSPRLVPLHGKARMRPANSLLPTMKLSMIQTRFVHSWVVS